MDYSKIKKLFLRGFIGFLVLTAIIAIIAVLSESFGDTQMRILGSTFTISIASILAMACAAFIERRSKTSLGLAGIVTTIIGAILLLMGIWSIIETDFSFKVTASFITVAVAFAHAFLLALPDLDKNYLWVQQTSALTISIIAVLIITALWSETENLYYYRTMAVVAILVGLQSVVIPILNKLSGKENSTSKELLLTHVDANLYKNSSGDIFEVKVLDSTEL